MDLKELFGEKSLSYSDFEKAISGKGIKLADIASGEYVTKEKYDAQVTVAKDWKTKHSDLSKSVDGDEGYKTKLAQLETERDDYKGKYETLNEKATNLERSNSLTKLGVEDKFTKFALSEINGMVTDSVDFETASKKWASENAQFVSVKDESNTSVTLNQPTGTNRTLTDSKATESSQMNNVLRGALK